MAIKTFPPVEVRCIDECVRHAKYLLSLFRRLPYLNKTHRFVGFLSESPQLSQNNHSLEQK